MALTYDLSGKTAVITGSNSGIGLGIAHQLAQAGANIVLNSFTDNKEDHALAKEIAELGDIYVNDAFRHVKRRRMPQAD